MSIKLGQVLSTRSDLLLEVYRAELATLQDEVPPLPERLIADVIRENSGAPDKIFAFLAGELVLQGFVGRPGADHLRDSALDLAELVSDLPRRLDRVLGEIEQGNLRIWTRLEDMEPLVKRLERVAARTNATILVAACIIGLAMVIPFYYPQGSEAWIGIVFWIAAVAVVAGSLRALWRLRK